MNCKKCNKELTPVTDYPHRRKLDHYVQYENALLLTFGGGYGMFFDGADTEIIICGECATELIKENPWFGEMEHPFGTSYKLYT